MSVSMPCHRESGLQANIHSLPSVGNRVAKRKAFNELG